MVDNFYNRFLLFLYSKLLKQEVALAHQCFKTERELITAMILMAITNQMKVYLIK